MTVRSMNNSEVLLRLGTKHCSIEGDTKVDKSAVALPTIQVEVVVNPRPCTVTQDPFALSTTYGVAECRAMYSDTMCLATLRRWEL